jgi:hypothetical protein
MAKRYRARGRVGRSTIARLRTLPSADAISALAIYAKQDRSYRPIKDATSCRWHLCTAIGEFEILTTASKWYDTRARVGGGGAIDLAMHLLGLSFIQAVEHLQRRTGANG